MPILAPKKDEAKEKKGQKMSPEEDRRPDVNYKDENGLTALHAASSSGAPTMLKRLLDDKADPNVPATSGLVTPLDIVLSKLAYEEERENRVVNFDTINRMDDTALVIKVDVSGWRKCEELLLEAGGVEAKIKTDDFLPPNIKPDGSVNGGPPSPLRAYDAAEDGTYTAAHHLRTGKFDVLKVEGDLLVQAEYDPKTGHWDVGNGFICKDEEVSEKKGK
eukprot:TRINITY_DN45317_c0_g1_i2.p2 TRINITY_DN45317_c0_g1~~TRINITY_DN45317_c0_g1_i2.p2  ORF type:complete len:219 (-),score=68.70 TRINITY_DN45317_c0_g1_i2:81-737(-)